MKKAKPKYGWIVVIRESRDMIGQVHFIRSRARDALRTFGRACRLAKVKLSEVAEK